MNRVKIIKNSINKGVASANNKGISSAMKDNCSHILLLNNDVEFGDNLFEILIKSIRSDKYSLVSPKINFFDKDTILASTFHLKMMKITTVGKIKHLSIYNFNFLFINKF